MDGLKVRNMIRRYFSRLLLEARKALGYDYKGKLKSLEKLVKMHEEPVHRTKLRVLIGPSFAIWPPSFALDRTLSLALRIRGADVVPIYCDSIQRVECNFFGGDWGGKDHFSKNCKYCKKTSEQLWHLNPNKPIPLSKYLSQTDAKQTERIVSTLDFDGALNFRKGEIAYGRMAKDILVNNYLVATPTLVDDYERLLKIHLTNLLNVSLAYERILDEQTPDRVVSNDSYYGMWAILEQHCKVRGIPFYSHWSFSIDRVAFAHDDAAMNLDFTKSWPNFSRIPLTSGDEERIENWLSGNRGYVIDTAKLTGHETDDPALANLDPNLPTLVLATNVIWDLTALNKQILFGGMVDWIIETINWFRDKEHLQLVIRPHPAETSPQIPKTRETVAAALKLNGVQLPRNVVLLKSDINMTIKQLTTRYDVRGITVHSSTVGFEFPAQGISVVTTARSAYRGFGFTIDPISKYEYFLAIQNLLSGGQKSAPASMQVLARKFIKFYQFHYYSKLGLFEANPPKIAADAIGILRSRHGPFAHVVDSILEGIAINDENRWLPES